MTSLLGRSFALVIGLTVGVLVVEAGVRALGLDRPLLSLAIVGSKSPTSAYHPRLGWVNLPDSAGWLRWPGTERTFRLTTNHQGFRFGRDFTPEKQQPHRLALVGDSQVFGLIVGDDEHLGAVLDRDMAGVETYPFGVPGYGPTQEMLLLEETVLDYEPDVVGAVLFLHNDLNDQTQHIAYGFLQRPVLARTDGAWSVTNVPVPLPITPSPPASRVFFRPDPEVFGVSALYRLAAFRSVAAPWLADGLAGLGLGALETIAVRPQPDGRPDPGFRRADGKEPACNVVGQCPIERWLDGLPSAVAAYERMAASCARRGARFFAVVAPAPLELTWRKLGLTHAAVDALRAKGIDTVSLEEPFMRFPDPMTLIAPDRHWTAEGTRVAAAVVQEHVQALLGAAR